MSRAGQRLGESRNGQKPESDAAESHRLIWQPEIFKNRHNSQTGNDTSLFFHSLARAHTQARVDTRAIAMETDKRRAGLRGALTDKACAEMGRPAGTGGRDPSD